MKAFVLTDNDGQIKDRDMLDLYDGYLSLGLNVKMFTKSDLCLNKNLITRNDVFGGHIDICRIIWRNIGVTEPFVDCYPKQLESFLGRRIKQMKLKGFYEVLEENENFGNEYFVKPVKNKLFTGFVCTTKRECDGKIPCSIDTNVYVSTHVNFDAEFRAYIFNDKIIDVFRYWGDNWSAVVDKGKVEEMVSLLKGSMPSFYSLDFGIDDKGRTLLVEVNDGYAIGNYGLSPMQYADMTMVRCMEIILNNSIPTI